MDAVDARLDEQGHHDRMIGVIPGNTRAAALYERRGYAPTMLTLTRFGRPPVGPPTSAGVPVETVAADEIDTLGPLWHALHRHHQALAPELGPFVDHGASWGHMRGLIAADDGGFLLRAGPAERPAAMAWVTISRDDPLWADTWVTGREVAEIRILVVADDERGGGLGSALLDEVDARLAGAGVHDQVVAAIAPNTAAVRLYERRGFRPTWLQLTRFAAREAPARA